MDLELYFARENSITLTFTDRPVVVCKYTNPSEIEHLFETLMTVCNTLIDKRYRLHIADPNPKPVQAVIERIFKKNVVSQGILELHHILRDFNSRPNKPIRSMETPKSSRAMIHFLHNITKNRYSDGEARDICEWICSQK
jgi:hypothetical protein